MTTIPLPIQDVAELQSMSVTECMVVVCELANALTAAVQVEYGAEKAERDNPTPESRHGVVQARAQTRRISNLHNHAASIKTWRKVDIPDDDVLAEYNRVCTGGGDYDEDSRGTILREYKTTLGIRAWARTRDLRALQMRAAMEPLYMNMGAIRAEIAWWHAWGKSLHLSNHRLSNDFGDVETRQNLWDLDVAMGHVLNKLEALTAEAESELGCIQQQAGRQDAFALGRHPRVGAACPLRHLDDEVARIIFQFALL